MIKFGVGFDGGDADFSLAEIGDTFAVISYGNYGSGLQSAIDYTVTKVGKRDVKAIDLNCRGIAINKNRTFYNTFPVGSPQIISAKAEMQAKNRLYRLRKNLEAIRASEWDDEFLSAVESFISRFENSKDKLLNPEMIKTEGEP